MDQRSRQQRIVLGCLAAAVVLSSFLIPRLATHLTFVYDD